MNHCSARPKRIGSIGISLVIAMAACYRLAAEEPEVHQVQLLAEYITLDHKEAVAQVRRNMEASNANELRRSLQKMINAGSATLAASTLTTARLGTDGKSSSVNERIYATEWNPPNSVWEINADIQGNPKMTTNVFPTAFETRNEGFTMQFKAIRAQDNSTIDLNLAPAIVIQNGHITHGKEEGMITEPLFESQSTSTSISVAPGNYALVSMHTPRAATKDQPNYTNPKRTLLLVRATTDQEDERAEIETSEDKRAYKHNIGLLAEFIEMDVADAVELSWIDTDPQNDQPIRNRAQQLLDDGRAKHLETVYLATRNGRRAKVESVAELTYPTEMGGPPELPKSIRGSVSKNTDLTTSQSYTAFETRNIGTTFEVDAVLGADKSSIDINLAPEIADLIGWDFHGKGPGQVFQPVITSLGISTAVSASKDRAILVAMQTPVDRKSRKRRSTRRILVFITGAVKEVAE